MAISYKKYIGKREERERMNKTLLTICLCCILSGGIGIKAYAVKKGSTKSERLLERERRSALKKQKHAEAKEQLRLKRKNKKEAKEARQQEKRRLKEAQRLIKAEKKWLERASLYTAKEKIMQAQAEELWLKNAELFKKIGEEKEESKKLAQYKFAQADIAEKKQEAIKVDLKVSADVPVKVAIAEGDVVIEPRVKPASVRASATERKRKDIYMLPTWPSMVLPFEAKDMLVAQVAYNRAGRAYSSKGTSQDISKLIFGEGSMAVKDIFLASKLVNDGQVVDYTGGKFTANTDNFLGAMADQCLAFDANIDLFTLSFDYLRHFIDKSLIFGVRIPLVLRRNTIKLETTLTDAVKNKIEESTVFKKRYADSFEAFFSDILCHKGIAFNKRDTEQGIGDVHVYLNWDLRAHYLDRSIVGIDILIPTAKERNTDKLWDPELGNGGFVEVSAFASFFKEKYRIFNPHLFVKGTYCFSADVKRRVPKYRSATAVEPGREPLTETLAMGEDVRTKYVSDTDKTDFNQVDTSFRRFATDDKKVKIRKGMEVTARIGNMIDGLIFKRGFGDVYYEVRVKGSDYLGKEGECKTSTACDGTYKRSILTDNTFEVAHTLGAAYSYQFDETVRTVWGLDYVLAGRNTPRMWEANASLLVEF